MSDRLSGVPKPDKPTRQGSPTVDNERKKLGASRSPRIPPLPAEPPDILPRVLFIDDKKVNVDNAQAIFDATPLREHARLETFLYKSDPTSAL